MAMLGGLVHVFNVLETERLRKYTIYKIQMVSFPKNEHLFPSLTKLTVTKRYSDFKTLEKSLLCTYKGYGLKTFFKSDTNFFNRFDPEIIEQRKRTILEFLYYCAEHSIIYRSQHFVKFFDDTSTKYDVEAICDTSIHPEESPEESINSIEESEAVEEGIETNEEIAIERDIDYYLCGYLYDAALNFSQAVQEEANLRYKCAFELYKSGIDKLLTGAKNDNNEMRKRIAKTKASKYLEKAEQLYENYILEQQENEFLIEDIDTKETQSIASLERPLNHMSRYRVIQINGRIMKVQDRTDKKIYILKVIWKSHSHKVLFMPQNIPFMCSLLSYFHSENAIFLLLPFISGGLLWDYIQNYSSDSLKYDNLEEIFVDPPMKVVNSIDNLVEQEINLEEIEVMDVENILEIIQADEVDASQPSAISLNNSEDNDLFSPSFDTLKPDIDVDDLMKCSQQLLKSVTKTLEKSVILSSSDVNIKEIQLEKSLDVEPLLFTKEIEKNLKISQSSESSIQSNKNDLPEIALKRWACEIIICVNSLHKNGIIIGDLNLDNVLLGPNGHILLTYFHQNTRNNYQQLCELNRKSNACQYIAFDFPLTKMSDYYSIGVILYEIFTKTRFYTLHPNGITKFNEIQYSESCQLSEQAKDLLDVLVFRRFDQDSPFENIKAHSFFKGLDFDEIETFGYK